MRQSTTHRANGNLLKDGDIPLDNYRTEHALRQQVLGRVNWLFAGSDHGGETAAVFFTLMTSCKCLRIDPFAYLRDVFTWLPEGTSDTELRELLPRPLGSRGRPAGRPSVAASRALQKAKANKPTARSYPPARRSSVRSVFSGKLLDR